MSRPAFRIGSIELLTDVSNSLTGTVDRPLFARLIRLDLVKPTPISPKSNVLASLLSILNCRLQHTSEFYCTLKQIKT